MAADNSTLGKACLHWFLTNFLGSIILWWLPGYESASYFEEDASMLVICLPIAFFSLLFIPMAVLLFHELLLLPNRTNRLLATAATLILAHLTVCSSLLFFSMISSHQPLLQSFTSSLPLFISAPSWVYLLAALLAAALVYHRGLFRSNFRAHISANALD